MELEQRIEAGAVYEAGAMLWWRSSDAELDRVYGVEAEYGPGAALWSWSRVWRWNSAMEIEQRYEFGAGAA